MIFIRRTISIAKGKGSIGHNTRQFKTDNVNEGRTKYNICYVNEDIELSYKKLFAEALENYNNKQKRNDRKIENYYEKIRTSKQEKLFYELVVQIGNCDDMGCGGENEELAKNILNKYMNDFQYRNPNLYVFSAHLHMDEATPHLHIDYIPYSTNNKRGLETKNSLKGALLQQGFNGGTRGDTELNQWQNSEKEKLAKVMLEYGVEWEQKGTHKEHLSVLDYKKEMRQNEINELDNKKKSKYVELDMLDSRKAKQVEEVTKLENKTEEVDANLSKLLNADLELNESIEEKQKLIEVEEEKLNELKKQTNKINTNVYKYYEDDEYILPKPKVMESAKNYENRVSDVVTRLKSELTDLIVQFVNVREELRLLKDKYDKLDKNYNSLSNRHSQDRKVVEVYKKLENILGVGKIQELVSDYERKLREQQLSRKINRKNRDAR